MARDKPLTELPEAQPPQRGRRAGDLDSGISFQDIVESSRIITETASDAIITIDQNSRILFVNRATVNIFGYSMEEMLGAELTMLMPEYLRRLHRAGLKNYLESGKKHMSWVAVELPGLHKSGKEISLELSFGEFQKDGRRFFTGIARDVTLRKQDEKRLAALQKVTDVALAHLSLDELLRESINRIREALNVDTVAILLLRTEGDELVAWAAQGLQEEVEQGVRIPVGRGFAGRVLAQCQPIIIEDISQADVYNPLLREKGIKSLLGVPLVVEGRAIGVLHVGTLEFAHFTEDDVRLLQLAADRIALAIENARLYQVEKIARAEAEDANRAKDEFLTILSHELRTPLTPIIGWVQMMQTGILPTAEFNQALSVISRNAQSLKRLINDLLDMSAIMSGKMRIDETLLSLADVLSESVDTMRPYAREANVDLQLEIADGASAMVIKGDRSRLSQIFCNILHNAIKFSPTGGYVQVSCEARDSAAIVRIADQGEGIPAEFLPFVFERFRQADGSRTRAYGGLGLGLALVKSFVQAHGGTVEAASNGAGKGSEFVVKLPREALPTGENGKNEAKLDLEKNAKRARVLIVEDQPDTLEMLATHFQTRGYETLPCSSAAEAIQIADREPFDILISDIAMPEIDGLQLIRTLRQKKGLEGIPAIALTGYASEKDAETAIAAGFNTHLAKPIEPARLSAAVERLLNSCQSWER
jgi:PAS domain S-box-containing protein